MSLQEGNDLVHLDLRELLNGHAVKAASNYFIGALVITLGATLLLLSLLGRTVATTDLLSRLAALDERLLAFESRLQGVEQRVSATPPPQGPGVHLQRTESVPIGTDVSESMSPQPESTTRNAKLRPGLQLRQDIKEYDLDGLLVELGLSDLSDEQTAAIADILAEHQAECTALDEAYYRRLDEIKTEQIQAGSI